MFAIGNAEFLAVTLARMCIGSDLRLDVHRSCIGLASLTLDMRIGLTSLALDMWTRILAQSVSVATNQKPTNLASPEFYRSRLHPLLYPLRPWFRMAKFAQTAT